MKKVTLNEKEIQDFWKKNKVFKTDFDSNKEKFYCLDMFPYPSGDGVHVGHIKGYTATDIISKYKRLKGFNVLHPMGWDAFGLPAENYAIKVGKSPKDAVAQNIAKFKSQLDSMGFSYDWDLEINTTDSEYYKWTQWIFLKLFKKGLAYQDEYPINFCPSCKTGLANEEVVSGLCERCGTKVIKKNMRQWILRITEYAEKLLNDVDDLQWPVAIKQMQKNWIGKSSGTEIIFDIVDNEGKEISEFNVFTTRADTLFGCTYTVIAPEHKKIRELKQYIQNITEVEEYIESSINKSDLERTDLAKDKTGVALNGLSARNPINGKTIPIWLSDYVLANYGTGCIMAVPAHDERDFEFAKKFQLEIKKVVSDNNNHDKCFTGNGILVNSGKFNGMESAAAKEEITKYLESIKKGRKSVSYKLRDWIFSRQRYWGEPIPVVHCEKCGTVAVPYDSLPVKLPEIDKYEPTGTGESPLATITDWVNTDCPKCGGKAKRETNTMPQWAGSCWYYLRYLSPNDSESAWNTEIEKKYMPVDLYIGGAEHAVLHLLYARFWHKFLFDEGLLSTNEPFKKLRNVGLILAQDRQKMSKSKGNVINPTEVTKKYSVDALRMYEMFIGPFDQPAVWNPTGIVGVKKFLDKILLSFNERNRKENGNPDIKDKLNGLVLNIENKIINMQFNTAVSEFMKFSNSIDMREMDDEAWKIFSQILSPFAPHLSETIWLSLNNNQSVLESKWPEVRVDESNRLEKYIVQVNGKKIELLEVGDDIEKNEVIRRASNLDKVTNRLLNKEIKNTIFVKGKIVNFVLK